MYLLAWGIHFSVLPNVWGHVRLCTQTLGWNLDLMPNPLNTSRSREFNSTRSSEHLHVYFSDFNCGHYGPNYLSGSWVTISLSSPLYCHIPKMAMSRCSSSRNVHSNFLTCPLIYVGPSYYLRKLITYHHLQPRIDLKSCFAFKTCILSHASLLFSSYIPHFFFSFSSFFFFGFHWGP